MASTQQREDLAKAENIKIAGALLNYSSQAGQLGSALKTGANQLYSQLELSTDQFNTMRGQYMKALSSSGQFVRGGEYENNKTEKGVSSDVKNLSTKILSAKNEGIKEDKTYTRNVSDIDRRTPYLQNETDKKNYKSDLNSLNSAATAASKLSQYEYMSSEENTVGGFHGTELARIRKIMRERQIKGVNEFGETAAGYVTGISKAGRNAEMGIEAASIDYRTQLDQLVNQNFQLVMGGIQSAVSIVGAAAGA